MEWINRIPMEPEFYLYGNLFVGRSISTPIGMFSSPVIGENSNRLSNIDGLSGTYYVSGRVIGQNPDGNIWRSLTTTPVSCPRVNPDDRTASRSVSNHGIRGRLAIFDEDFLGATFFHLPGNASSDKLARCFRRRHVPRSGNIFF